MNDSQPHSIECGGQWLEKLVSEAPELARARDHGVDLWTLVANLHRTPEERIRRHETALSTFKLLYQRAGR
jgi:hypothetical protein